MFPTYKFQIPPFETDYCKHDVFINSYLEINIKSIIYHYEAFIFLIDPLTNKFETESSYRCTHQHHKTKLISGLEISFINSFEGWRIDIYLADTNSDMYIVFESKETAFTIYNILRKIINI